MVVSSIGGRRRKRLIVPDAENVVHFRSFRIERVPVIELVFVEVVLDSNGRCLLLVASVNDDRPRLTADAFHRNSET